MVGEALIPLGASKFLGITYPNEPIAPLNFAVAAATLFCMIALNVWGRGKLRLYGVLLGLIIGYALSLVTDLFASGQNCLCEWMASP